jgi:hypothetical protein
MLSNILYSRLSPYVGEMIGEITSVGFNVTDQILVILSAFVTYWRKKLEYNETVHQKFIDFKKAHDSVRREEMFNILIEFWVPMKFVQLIKICLYETYSKACIGKHLSDSVFIQNCLK